MACVNRLSWRMARVVRSMARTASVRVSADRKLTSPITSVATAARMKPAISVRGWRSGWPPGGSMGWGHAVRWVVLRGKGTLYRGAGRAPGQEAQRHGMLLHSVRPARVCGTGSPPLFQPLPAMSAVSPRSRFGLYLDLIRWDRPAGLAGVPVAHAQRAVDCGRRLSGLAPAHRVCAGHHPHAQRGLLRERRGRPRL